MFIVLLKFSDNKAKAGQFMEGHKAWLKRGFDDGIFLMAGSLKPQLGGGIMAHNISRDALQAFVGDDPFVAHDIVAPEIIEFEPSQQRPELQGLFG
ncbi:YciI family protein [Pseudolabrys sp. FHR47]|uniref:YciI family protein n=1 Tax=Pseudolabrys sp. FHR47 TaxID=2562284 RepID=UPI0010BEA242|nr:YciI family protein [Pseudolabrys sp. FHR47]